MVSHIRRGVPYSGLNRSAGNKFMPMKSLLAFVGLTALLVAPVLALQERAQLRSLSSDGVALGGYDPVSCFPAGGMAATVGTEKFEVKVGVARYRFASAEHLAWFQAERERYPDGR